MIGLILAVIVVGVLVVVRRRAGRGVDELRDLAGAAGAVARELRQGAGLHQSLISVAESERAVSGRAVSGRAVSGRAGPTSLPALADRLSSGVSIADSIQGWIDDARRSNSSGPVQFGDLELLGNALLMGFHFGGDTPAALEAAASTLMQRADLAEETAALTSQARASMWTLCALPVVAVGVFSAVDPGIANTLLGTPSGRFCLAIGLSLETASVLVARHMVRRTLR